MRSVKKAPPRRRTGPRWLRPVLRVAVAVAGSGLLTAALWFAGHLAWRLDRPWRGVVAASAGLGVTVSDIFVEGRRETASAQILSSLGVRPGDPLLAFDPHATRRRLEALPWVRQAAVERHFPNTIYVRLIERQPLALWQRDNGFVIIDRDGTPISGADIGRFATLPVVVGDEAPAHAADLLDLLDSEPALKRRVTAAVWVGNRRWNLRIDDQVDVRLPEEDVGAAWERLAQLDHDHQLLERDIGMVDLRFGDRVILGTEKGMTPPRHDWGAKPTGKSTT